MPEIKSASASVGPRGSSNRAFGLVFAAFFLIVGSVPLARRGEIRPWTFILAAFFFVIALIFPQGLELPNRIWLGLGELLHRLTSPIALAIIYLVGIVPVGMVRQRLGHDPLRLRRRSVDTYWIPRTPPARPDGRMNRQF